MLLDSTLGPFLFLVYINDLNMATSLKLNLFADDAYLCKSNISPIRLEETINYGPAQFYRWLNLNKLSLNRDKTSYMIVTNI